MFIYSRSNKLLHSNKLMLMLQALPDPSVLFITYVVFYCAVVLSFLLNFFVDPPPQFSNYPKVEVSSRAKITYYSAHSKFAFILLLSLLLNTYFDSIITSETRYNNYPGNKFRNPTAAN